MTEETTKDTVATEAAVSNLRIMDEELYNRLNGMFNSSDKEHWPIAEDILMTIDIDKSIYWIWKIVRNHWWRFNRRRKAVRENLTQQRTLCIIVSKTDHWFADWLVKEKRMTEEIWNRLQPAVMKHMESKIVNPWFDVELKMKKLW